MTEENGKARELPKGWALTNIGEIAQSMQNGIYKPAHFYSNDGIACLRMYNIENGRIVWKDIKRMILSKEEIEQYKLEPKDILINRVNSRELVGKAAPIPQKIENCVYESKNIRLRLFKNLVESKLVGYYFLLYSRKYFNQNAQQTVGMASINQEQISLMPFSLPPFNEQIRIVEKIEELFSDLDKGIEDLKTAQKQLKVYRQAVLKWAFEGQLTEEWREQAKQAGSRLKTGEELLAEIKIERENRYQQQLVEWEEAVKEWEMRGRSGKKPAKPQKPKELPLLTKSEFSELPLLPENWCWVRVGNLTYKVTVGHVGSMKDEYVEKGVPFLRSQNVRENRFDSEGLKYVSRQFHDSLSKSQLNPGDIAIVRSGNVGTACVIPDTLKEANCSDLVIIKKPFLASSELISYYFNSVTKTRVREKKVGVALTHFNTQSVEEFAIPFTTLEEQEQIVQEVESRLSICDRLEDTIVENLQKAEALRQSILKQAFEGKLVPQDPNDEPAEKLLERIKADRQAKQSKASEQLKKKGI